MGVLYFSMHGERKILLRMLLASVTCLQFSVQEEGVLEHTNVKRH